MKYIDADKLIAEIRNHRSESCISESDEYYEYAKSEIIDIITSLQEEQPDGYNRAMLEVKAKVDELYDETSIGLNEYDAGLYNGIAETCMKLRGFIKARISSQEQPDGLDEAKIIADLFGCPCNYSPIDEEMCVNCDCEYFCGTSEQTDAKCWQRYFDLKRKGGKV